MNTPVLLFLSTMFALPPAGPGGGGPGPIRLDPWLDPSCLLQPSYDPPVPWSSRMVLLPPPGACAEIAFTAREAGFADARDDYLVAVANCINEGGSVWSCALQHLPELHEARQHVSAVYADRLDVCDRSGGDRYDPALVPANFTAHITNPFFPLVPGRTLVYRKQTTEGLERDRVTTRTETVVIDGVTCRSVRDVVRLDGELIEDTDDWYAQDLQGNVWYLGELAKNYEDGQLSDLDGSWRSGLDHAKAGIVMRAGPQVGDFYRQEFRLGEAEDVAVVVSRTATVVVPYGTFTNCLATEDWSPLEPDHRERKYYAAGIGHVLTVNLQTGERQDLVQVLGP
jgi:hypothetical protein